MANGKVLKILSQDITRNTTDNLRKALGTYYTISAGSDEQPTFHFIDFFEPTDPLLPDRPINVPADGEEDLRGRNVIRAELSDQLNSVIEKIQINPALMESPQPDAYFPNIKIPFRLYANKDKASGDSFWKTYFMGGTFGDLVYPRLINTSTIFYDLDVELYHPYSFAEFNVSTMITDAKTSTWKIQPNYNDYDKFVHKYQDWTYSKHELLLPNYNLAFTEAVIYGGPETIVDTSDGIPTAVIGGDWEIARDEFLAEHSSVGEFTEPADRILRDLMQYYYPEPEIMYGSSKNAYFGNNWLQIVQNDSLRKRVVRLQRNIMFDQNYYEYFKDFIADDITSATDLYDAALESMGQSIDNSSNMMNVEINFTRNKSAVRSSIDPSEASDVEIYENYNYSTPLITGNINGGANQPFRIRDAIEDNNFSSKFLEILKDMTQNVITEIPFSRKRYDVASKFLTPDEVPTTMTSFADLRTFDWMQFLIYTYNKYSVGLNENYCFMGPPKIVHSSTYSDSTFYRFVDNQNLLEVIDETIDLAQEYFDGLYNVKEQSEARAAMLDGDETGLFDEIDKKVFNTILSPVQKHHEVLAYKVDKVGGVATGDSNTQNTLQTFWSFNSRHAPDNISIIDTQVKYGQSYTYAGYAYVAVMSHKYKYSSFRLTKQIGTHDFSGDGNLDTFCLQFYNPINDNLAEQVFADNRSMPTIGAETSMTSIDTFASSTLAGFNTFATNGQEFSVHPQLADFNLIVEPCIKIIEVPIFTKTVKVLDNPPNNISIVPFHFVNEDNKLGFNMFSDGFNDSNIYPIPITDVDLGNRSDYLNNKDLTLTDSIKLFSESPARFIEVFRTTTKPKSFKDFDGKLVSRIDLRIQDTDFNTKEYIAADEVKTNIKYYYVFRFVNENGLAGQLSSVIEAELHNDGGYVYSLFDILDSSEFIPDPYVETTTKFKKIFQLEPNIQQLILDSTNADFSKTARSQVNNVHIGTSEVRLFDSNKKFKIRLTSKKSRKKLDINVVYNVREKDLTDIEQMYQYVGSDDATYGSQSEYEASKESRGTVAGNAGSIKLSPAGQPDEIKDSTVPASRNTGAKPVLPGLSSGDEDEIVITQFGGPMPPPIDMTGGSNPFGPSPYNPNPPGATEDEEGEGEEDSEQEDEKLLTDEEFREIMGFPKFMFEFGDKDDKPEDKPEDEGGEDDGGGSDSGGGGSIFDNFPTGLPLPDVGPFMMLQVGPTFMDGTPGVVLMGSFSKAGDSEDSFDKGAARSTRPRKTVSSDAYTKLKDD